MGSLSLQIWLSAALLCLPHVWSDAIGEREQSDLQRIAKLITSNSRELSHSASLCLQTLMESRPLRMTAPVLHAIAKMVLACQGARAIQLQRALSLATFLVSNAIDSLPDAISAARTLDDDPGVVPEPTEVECVS